MGISMKKMHDPLIFFLQIDVITNFAVITNVVIKRVHFTIKSHSPPSKAEGKEAHETHAQ